jgi:hypothetical protein
MRNRRRGQSEGIGRIPGGLLVVGWRAPGLAAWEADFADA